MYSSVYTLGARCLYSGGCQCSNDGHWDSGGYVLSAAWSEATRLPGCGTVTSAAEAPTGVCHILAASQSCRVVAGSAVGSSHAV